jgi:hypothetical protein
MRPAAGITLQLLHTKAGIHPTAGIQPVAGINLQLEFNL